MDEVLKGVCSSRGGDREIRRKMCDDAKELLFFCKVMAYKSVSIALLSIFRKIKIAFVLL